MLDPLGIMASPIDLRAERLHHKVSDLAMEQIAASSAEQREVRQSVFIDYIAAHLLDAEICNGGFRQYLGNSGAKDIASALRGYAFLGLDDLRSHVLAIAQRLLQDEPERFDKKATDNLRAGFHSGSYSSTIVGTVAEIEKSYYATKARASRQSDSSLMNVRLLNAYEKNPTQFKPSK